MKIDTLLKKEAGQVVKFQTAYKKMVYSAIKKHGLNKSKVSKEVEKPLLTLTTNNVKYFLKLGVSWLK